MSTLSMIILCGRAPRHLYVANRLCRAGKALAIIQETATQWTLRKVLTRLKPANLSRKAWRWLRDRKRYTGGGEAKFFFGDEAPRLDRPDLVHEVPYINHPTVTALVDRLQPDIICVFGTSLIRQPLLGKGRLGMVNLHGGLSPEYRGADCTFWALYNAEPEKAGCTLHFIDAGIDTGRLIAHVCPEVLPDDGELTLFWRAVKDSAEVYAETLDRLERAEPMGKAQLQKGRLYQVRDRGWRHERALEARLNSGPLVETPLPTRVTWFTAREP